MSLLRALGGASRIPGSDHRTNRTTAIPMYAIVMSMATRHRFSFPIG